MNHIKLEELDLADMLDVIHYFYEEDLNFFTIEHAKMAEVRRVAIYKHLYNVDYKYGSGAASSGVANGGFDGEDLEPFDPSNAPVKSYFPPTEMDADSSSPFGGVLDAPIN